MTPANSKQQVLGQNSWAPWLEAGDDVCSLGTGSISLTPVSSLLAQDSFVFKRWKGLGAVNITPLLEDLPDKDKGWARSLSTVVNAENPST